VDLEVDLASLHIASLTHDSSPLWIDCPPVKAVHSKMEWILPSWRAVKMDHGMYGGSDGSCGGMEVHPSTRAIQVH